MAISLWDTHLIQRTVSSHRGFFSSHLKKSGRYKRGRCQTWPLGGFDVILTPSSARTWRFPKSWVPQYYRTGRFNDGILTPSSTAEHEDFLRSWVHASAHHPSHWPSHCILSMGSPMVYQMSGNLQMRYSEEKWKDCVKCEFDQENCGSKD